MASPSLPCLRRDLATSASFGPGRAELLQDVVESSAITQPGDVSARANNVPDNWWML